MDTLINDLANTILCFTKASDALLLSLPIPDCSPYLELVNKENRWRLALEKNNSCWINQCKDINLKPNKQYFLLGCIGDIKKFQKSTSGCMSQLIRFIEGLAYKQHQKLFEEFIDMIPIDLLLDSTQFKKASMRVWLLLGFNDEKYILSKMNQWEIQFNPDILGIISYKNHLGILEHHLQYCNNDINNVDPYVIGYLYEQDKLSLLDNFNGPIRNEKQLEPIIIRLCLAADLKALDYISRFTDKHTFNSCLHFISYGREIDKYRNKIFKECWGAFWSESIINRQYYSLDDYSNYRIIELLKPFICQKKWFDGTLTMFKRKEEFNKPATLITELIHDYIRNNKMSSLKELCIVLITNGHKQVLKEVLLNDEFKNSSLLLSLFKYLTMSPKNLRIKYRHDTGLRHPSGMKRLQLLVKFIDMSF